MQSQTLRQSKSHSNMSQEKGITHKPSIGEKLHSLKHSLEHLAFESKKHVLKRENDESMKEYLISNFKDSNPSLNNKYLIDNSKGVVLNMMHRNLSVPSLKRRGSSASASLSSKSSQSSLSSNYSNNSNTHDKKVAKPDPKHAIYAPFQKGFTIRRLDSDVEFCHMLQEGFQKQDNLHVNIPTLFLTLTPSKLRV